MSTFGDLLSKHNISVPDHIEAQVDIPVITGAQRQGDVGVFPVDGFGLDSLKLVPQPGVQVVRGESSGNTHWLDGDGDVRWLAKSGLVLGLLYVGEGATAFLTHTDEHGSNAIGSGFYELRGKRELRDEIVRVED